MKVVRQKKTAHCLSFETRFDRRGRFDRRVGRETWSEKCQRQNGRDKGQYKMLSFGQLAKKTKCRHSQ